MTKKTKKRQTVVNSKPRQGKCVRIETKKARQKGQLTFRVVTTDEEMTAGKKMPKPWQMDKSERSYFLDLHKVVDRIYQEAADMQMTWSKLAEMAGVANTTVDNLGMGVTKRPQFRTVYLLAKAVGWELVAQETKTKKKKPALRSAG